MTRKIFILVYIFISILILFRTFGMIVNSDVILNLNPKFEFPTYFLSWYQYLYLGIGNSINSSYIFPFGFFYYIFLTFLPSLIGQAFLFSIFILGGFMSFYLFISEEFKNASYEKYIGSAFYIFNMYFILNFSGSLILLLPFIILPLQLFFLNRILKNKNYFLYSLGFAISTIIMGGANLPLSFINLIIILFYFIYLLVNSEIFKRLKELIFKIIVTALITFLTNLYWIFGVFLYYLSMRHTSFQNIIGSESFIMDNKSTSYLNVLRILGLWSFEQGANNTPYFNYASIYLHNIFFIFSLFIIPIFVLVGLFFLKDKLKKYFLILVLFIITVPLEVGANQGIFKSLYIWLYLNVPYFAMFRNTYKFAQIFIFVLSFFLVLIIFNIKNKKYKLFISLILGFIIIINAFPFFTGRLFEKTKEIKEIPQYFYSAQQFFQKDETNHRIFLLPQQYFAQYTWGFTGGNPEIIWGKGIVARQPGTENQTPNNTLSLQIYKDLINRNYDEANKILHNLNIKYIVQRNDFAWYADKEYISSPASTAAMLKPYKKIATFGKLDVYQTPIASESSLFTGGDITFKQISPVQYQLEIKHLTSSMQLKFLESFHQDWKLYPSKNISCDVIAHNTNGVTECKPENEWLNFTNISYLFKPKLFDNTHKEIYDYANEWTLTPATLTKNFPESVKINPDGSINVYLSLYFIQQSYMEIVYLISGTTLFAVFIYAGHLLYRKKNEK